MDMNSARERRIVVTKLLAAWEKVPEFRLGQFLVCSLSESGALLPQFYLEDKVLVECCEQFAKAARGPKI
jgi:hypothetical protein